MEVEAKKKLLNSITEEEYKAIGESVLKKVANILDEYVGDYVKAKAYFQSSCANHEEASKIFEKKFIEVNQEKSELIRRCTALDVQSNEANRRLEHLSNTYSHKKNEAANDQLSAANTLAMREAELDRLKNDQAMLNRELKAVIQSRCEALAEKDEILSEQIAYKIKLEIFESQNLQSSKQIAELNADLELARNENVKQRREFKHEITILKEKIVGKEEELRRLRKEIVVLREQNSELTENLESSREIQRDQAEGMQEGLQQLLKTQSKLIDTFRIVLTESDSHSTELTGTVKELQSLLQVTLDQFGKIETNTNQLKQNVEARLLVKQQAITALKQELRDANNLLDAVKQNFQDTESRQSKSLPTSAPLNNLIKSGLTLTQMYTKFVEVYNYLRVEKQEKENFKILLEAVLDDIKARSQLNLRQQEEYEFMKSSVETLRRKVNNLETENVTLNKAKFEAESTAEHLAQSNNMLKDSVKYLSRQVCHFLRKVAPTRGNYLLQSKMPYSQPKSCSEVITTHMTTFSNVHELKLINLRLLVSVIELASDKDPNNLQEMTIPRREVSELEVFKKYLINYEGIEQLQLLNLQLLTSLKELCALREHQETENKSVKFEEKNSDDLFNDNLRIRELQEHILRLNAHIAELQKREKYLLNEIAVVSNQLTDLQYAHAEKAADEEKPNTISLEAQVQASQLIEDLRKEYESYKQSKSINEKILLETIDKLRTDFETAVSEREQFACHLGQQRALNEIMKNNFNTLHEEREKLKKEVLNNENIMKQLVDKMSRTNNEVTESSTKLTAAQTINARLKEENAMLKHTERLLLKEKQSQRKEKLGQEMLLASLETLKEKLESSRTSSSSKLESRLDEATSECTALRQRLEDEQNRFTSRIDLLEKQMIAAEERLEQEVAHRLNTSEQLNVYKAQIQEREQKLELLSQEVDVLTRKCQHFSEKENKIKVLQELIKKKEITINHLEKQLDINTKCMSDMCAISQDMEKQLANIVRQNDLKTQDSKKKISELQSIEEDLRSKMNDLDHKLKANEALRSEECATKNAEVSDLKKTVESLSVALNLASSRVEAAENEASKADIEKKAAERRTELLINEKERLNENLNEVHSTILTIRNELEKATQENSQLKDTFHHQRQSYEDKIKRLSEQAEHNQEHIVDLTKLNEILDDQIQKLETKVSILRETEMELQQKYETLYKENEILKTNYKEEQDVAKMLVKIDGNSNQDLVKMKKLFEGHVCTTGEKNNAAATDAHSFAMVLSKFEKGNEELLENEKLSLLSPLNIRQVIKGEKEEEKRGLESSSIVEDFDHVSAKHQDNKIESVLNRNGNELSTRQCATNSTPNFVTSQTETAHKKLHSASLACEKLPPLKRCRMSSLDRANGKEEFPSSVYCAEPEYQVPTSSQKGRDDYLSFADFTELGDSHIFQVNDEESQNDLVHYHKEEIQEEEITNDGCLIEQQNNDLVNMDKKNFVINNSEGTAATSSAEIGNKPIYMAEDAEKQEGKFSTTAEFENSLAASVSKNYGNSVMNSLRIIRSSSTIDWARGQQTSIIHPLQGTNQQTQNAAVDPTAFSRDAKSQPSASRMDGDSIRFNAAARRKFRKVAQKLLREGYFKN
ncbi:uncharacterized protein isoform X2 [Rhodnius prolixus]|uniref:uncharacterized protein isoform X2 n=1 Tax=Rhodnius prolixus TaxID=13249 RepID=UPI003D18F15E